MAKEISVQSLTDQFDTIQENGGFDQLPKDLQVLSRPLPLRAFAFRARGRVKRMVSLLEQMRQLDGNGDDALTQTDAEQDAVGKFHTFFEATRGFVHGSVFSTDNPRNYDQYIHSASTVDARDRRTTVTSTRRGEVASWDIATKASPRGIRLKFHGVRPR